MKTRSAGAAVLAAIAGLALLAGCARAADVSGSGSSSSTTGQSFTSTAAASTSPIQTSTASSATAATVPTTTTGGTGSSCLSANLTASLSAPEGAAGSSYYTLIFKNTGSESCTLQGFPGVSYVTGDDGRQVGAAAAWDGAKGPEVTLQPGGTATAQLQEVNVQNFPADICKPVSTRGLRVYPPGETAALFVPQPDGLGCQADPLPDGQFQLSVKTITAN